ncbi:MAG: HAMP domain-containing protein [Wenzhouxiangella sp.]|nr:MAG: HAMP domain-containing protein [Wenzhouxiangella sp.]
MRRLGLEARIGLALIAMTGLTLVIWLGSSLLGFPAWAAVVVLVATVAVMAWTIPGRILVPLVSLSSVLDAVRSGDYAQRLRADRAGIAGELAASVNLLSETLRQREGSRREADALLAKLLHEIDLAIFTFDDQGCLVLANPAARALVGLRLGPGVEARSLELHDYLVRDVTEPVHLVFPGGAGRFLVRRRPFRIEGRAHCLLVLTNAEAALGAERREAWQSLVRVLGHEINNSLTPIKSIAQTMADAAADQRSAGGCPQDSVEMVEGLNLIAARADTLGRFVAGYAALARLPESETRRIELGELVERVTEMETRFKVRRSGPDITVQADPDQLEQALINLVKNAVDAVQDCGDEVMIRWRQHRATVEIEVVDNGPGPPDSDNLFVPFFTTKPGGSGIGLLLSRRIAELHGGSLSLVQRQDAPGAVARLSLPLAGSSIAVR